jgi:hypothetical protein
VIVDKDSVELWLRRAQAAILSLRPVDEFLVKSAADLQNLIGTDQDPPFSKNVIRVDVRDPGLTDLSFVDLPGKKRTKNLEYPSSPRFN